ncbi:response regulator [Pseudopedobacter sp.]|uniref:response regulator n=1 Tax=Pseudopedobacter sp. TaxID=1936787 RepID=UPI0033428924
MDHLAVRRRLLLGISVSLILVAFVQVFAYLSLKGVEKDYDWVLHTEKVINENNKLIALISEAEANHRGYLLRGYDIFYQEYQQSINGIDDTGANLKELVNDNQLSNQRVDKLQQLISHKIKVMEDLLDLKRNQYRGDKTEQELAEEGVSFMKNIKTESERLNKYEHDLLIQRKENTNKALTRSVTVIVIGTFIVFLIVFILFNTISSAFEDQRKARKEIAEKNDSLADLNKKNENKNWLLTGISLLNNKLQGDLSVLEVSQNIVSSIAEYAGGKVGAIYIVDQENRSQLKLVSGYALKLDDNAKTIFDLSDGWVGQVARDGREMVIKGSLADHLGITSGLVKESPLHCILVPFSYNGKLKGVLEIGFLDEISDAVKDFILNSSQLLGVAVNTAESRETLKTLFEQTQQQAEELESQQEELRVSNEELLSKTELLQASEEELRVQQEELRQINIELEEKARVLENNNLQLENAKNTLAIKMQELEQASKYKSEFLANMSHELRTPLNSILILAKILKENKGGRLSDDETKYANVIHRAGADLLSLINDILDLSKIESGFIELNPENLDVRDLEEDLRQLFDEVAKNKGVNYVITKDSSLPDIIYVDRMRIEQVLKNLLSNAFKFTSKEGTVELFMQEKDDHLHFSVRDTGIGIAAEKQKIIFEAFQQADGSTNREYGGTGLGLSISRELSRLMNGQIILKSEIGKGSEFTLSIPINGRAVSSDKSDKETELLKVKEELPVVSIASFQKEENATNHPQRNKPLLMIVEDDVVFNDLLKDYATRGGFETIQHYSGEDAEQEIENLLPDAVLLDIMLPGIDGWQVLRNIKANPKIAYIPVHMMSAGDFSDKKAIKEGAISFLKKPLEYQDLDALFKKHVTKNNISVFKKVLLVEDQQDQSDALKLLFKDRNIDIVQALTGKEALETLESQSFDCVILDLNLPDINGMDLLEQIKKKDAKVPVIINTAMELEQDKLKQLLKYSDATVLKSPKSGDRLIDEVNLFLHKVKETEPSKRLKSIEDTESLESALKNKVVLLVDDDMRNIFSISAVLDQYGLKVEIANDGVEALEKLNELKVVDIVLMDIMMPRMDGYETMKSIRQNNVWKKLPIIALTAKAMKDDKERCIAAGANDYITKPIDNDQLVSLMKIWVS